MGLTIACQALTGSVPAASLATLEQQAFREAVAEVAESVVQIRAVGGLEQVGRVLMAGGPTTGLIVSADGYIVSSAFNFAQQPTSILVRLPGGRQTPARMVAHDRSRMLVLLKVESDQPLPIPGAAPADSMRVGQWALAVGRTFRADQVDVSIGVVSALRRMHGRMLQTDANVSPANYGGPLVDLHGRVLGVLVPMSPESQGNAAGDKGGQSEVAGVEYYDSGIGFAVPLAHILARLDGWKQGVDLEPGLMGISLIPGASFVTPPVIASVWPHSPAAAAGWKPDDRIVAVAGTAVKTQAQFRAQMVPRYADEQVALTIQRGDQRLQRQLTLTARLEVFRHAMLGILPLRRLSTPEGVAIRTVLPDSPAAQAGLRPGDRLIKISNQKVESSADALAALEKHHPEQEVTVTIVRGQVAETKEQNQPKEGEDKTDEQTLSIRLANLSADLLGRSDLPPARGGDLVTGAEQSREESLKENPEEGPGVESQLAMAPAQLQGSDSLAGADGQGAWQLESFQLPEFSHKTQLLRPRKMAADGSYPVLIWLGDQPEPAQSTADAWRPYCQRDGLLLLLPQPEDPLGWSSGDLRYLGQLVRAARRRLRGDPLRVAVAGRGKGGQLAYLLGLRHRVPAVIPIDTPLPRTVTLSENRPGQRLLIFSLESQNSPLLPLLQKDHGRLQAAGYPTARWELRAADGQLQQRDRDAMARWIDALDRL